MKLSRTLLLAACTGLTMPAAMAADSAYDVLIVACDRSACTRVAEQRLITGLANSAEYNRNGLKLMIERLASRTNEEDARISLNLHPSDEGANGRPMSVSLAQRLETLVVTLKRQTFSPLTSFVSDGATYQIWARLAAIR